MPMNLIVSFALSNISGEVWLRFISMVAPDTEPFIIEIPVGASEKVISAILLPEFKLSFIFVLISPILVIESIIAALSS